MEYKIYFDTKRMTNKLLIAMVVTDMEGMQIDQSCVVREITGRESPNDLALIGWVEALEYSIENFYSDVVFVNQNKMIFEWFRKANYTEERADSYRKVVELLLKLQDSGSRVDFEVCLSGKNIAKKYVSKKARDLGLPVERGNLLASLEQNKKALKDM